MSTPLQPEHTVESLKNQLELYKAGLSLLATLDMEQLQQSVTEVLARVAGANRSMGFFREKDHLVFKVSHGIPHELAEVCREELENLIASRDMSAGLPQLCQLPETSCGWELSPDMRQTILIPVCDKGYLLGLVAAFVDGDAASIHKERLDSLLFVSGQAASALQNAVRFTEARNLLFIDDLSGLYNHRYLEVVLDRELKRVARYSSQMSVLFIDVDSFKSVNDTYGHLVGSRILNDVGVLLRKSVRDVDVVIRYGGDEFTIILVESSPETTRLVAERMRERIMQHPFAAAEGVTIHLTCSIGYACCPDDTMDKKGLLELADRSMYAGKRSGKNCVSHLTQDGQLDVPPGS